MHTPGPWHRKGLIVYALNNDGFNRFDAQISPSDGSQYDPDGWQLENAQLIAAAPDLLEALELLYKDVGYLVGLCLHSKIKAKQAIAKAKGEE